MAGTREHELDIGETHAYVAPDATIVVEVVGPERMRVRCLGAPEHFHENGDCPHIDRLRELNPEKFIDVLAHGGPEYEEERQIDLDWRRDRSGTMPWED